MNGGQLSNEFAFKSADGGKEVLPRMAPVKELKNMYADRRMPTLMSTALTHAAAQLPANVNAESVLIVSMVDPELLDLTNGADQ